ncbi:MAG: hypothetical protein AAFO94_07950, partial [Bacteroidota bacterium]
MKNNYILYLLIFSLFISITACRKTDINPELVINVDDEFTLDLWEDLQTGSPQFNLLVQTIKEYDCADNTIRHRIDPRENIVVITLEQIDQKSDCTPGQAPASSLIPLEGLAPGNYGLRIKLKETIPNEGSLTITPKKYTLTLSDESVGIKLVRNELLRVPRGTIWGFGAYQSDSDKTYLDKFFSDLEQLGNIS